MSRFPFRRPQWAQPTAAAVWAFRRAGRAAIGPGLALLTMVVLLLIVAAQERAAIRSGLAETARQMLAAAEAPIAAATETLGQLAAAGHDSCAEASVAAFREAAHGPIIRIGVADAEGFLVCAGRGVRTPAEKLLPVATPRMPTVVIEVDGRPGNRRVVIAWASAAGPRLVAEIDPNVPPLNTGTRLAGFAPEIGLFLGGARVWRATAGFADLPSEAPTAVASSGLFPLSVTVALPREASPPGFASIRGAIIAAGMALALALGIAGWRGPAVGGGPRVVAARPTAAIRPFYWPVYQIDTRQVIGLDLVLSDSENPGPGSEAAHNLDSAMLDRVLTEISPILRRVSDLRLSVPFDIAHDSADRLISHLPSALARLNVDPGALVIRVPSEATANPLARARLDRLRRLDCAIATDGAGPGRYFVLSDPLPDFLFLDGRLADEIANSEQSLLITEAAVGLARRLGLGVIARGVVSEEGLAVLQAVGVTSAAGPVFGRYMNARSAADAVAAPVPTARAA